MFLVIRKINNNQIPLRIYQNIDDAVQYMNEYVRDSSKKWNYYGVFCSSKLETAKQKTKIHYYRYLKNGSREEINIKYMKVY